MFYTIARGVNICKNLFLSLFLVLFLGPISPKSHLVPQIVFLDVVGIDMA